MSRRSKRKWLKAMEIKQDFEVVIISKCGKRREDEKRYISGVGTKRDVLW